MNVELVVWILIWLYTLRGLLQIVLGSLRIPIKFETHYNFSDVFTGLVTLVAIIVIVFIVK